MKKKKYFDPKKFIRTPWVGTHNFFLLLHFSSIRSKGAKKNQDPRLSACLRKVIKSRQEKRRRKKPMNLVSTMFALQPVCNATQAVHALRSNQYFLLSFTHSDPELSVSTQTRTNTPQGYLFLTYMDHLHIIEQIFEIRICPPWFLGKVWTKLEAF
jgi:hypothetical protein